MFLFWSSVECTSDAMTIQHISEAVPQMAYLNSVLSL